MMSGFPWIRAAGLPGSGTRGHVPIAPEGADPGAEVDRELELLALHDALTGLERLDARQARIVELRFFGGLSVEETAEAAGVSTATVKREWRTARAWLRRELDSAGGQGART
jgi:RNA polymerase sigma factor (sigma-70 family)